MLHIPVIIGAIILGPKEGGFSFVMGGREDDPLVLERDDGIVADQPDHQRKLRLRPSS